MGVRSLYESSLAPKIDKIVTFLLSSDYWSKFDCSEIITVLFARSIYMLEAKQHQKSQQINLSIILITLSNDIPPTTDPHVTEENLITR